MSVEQQLSNLGGMAFGKNGNEKVGIPRDLEQTKSSRGGE